MEDSDPLVRIHAAYAWCAWEDAVVLLEPNGRSNAHSNRPMAALAFVCICARYFAHGGWLEECVLLRDAGHLTGIPGVLIHGRLDPECAARDRVRTRPRLTRRVTRCPPRLQTPGQRTKCERMLAALDKLA
jgi:hypothetical protein